MPVLDTGYVVARAGHWYGCIVTVGRHEGWPMVTFTDEAAAAQGLSPPGPAYRAVIAEGLAEAHGLNADQADAYIARHSA